jgi:hypothetical protein
LKSGGDIIVVLNGPQTSSVVGIAKRRCGIPARIVGRRPNPAGNIFRRRWARGVKGRVGNSEGGFSSPEILECGAAVQGRWPAESGVDTVVNPARK